MSYLRSLQRHAAMEYGEVSSVVALKAGVGDNLVSCGDTSTLELLCGPQGRAIPASTPILTLLEQPRDSDQAGVSLAHKKEDRLDWEF